jgi:hypothetical protein
LRQVHLLWAVRARLRNCWGSVPFQAKFQVSSDQDRHERRHLAEGESKPQKYHLQFE